MCRFRGTRPRGPSPRSRVVSSRLVAPSEGRRRRAGGKARPQGRPGGPEGLAAGPRRPDSSGEARGARGRGLDCLGALWGLRRSLTARRGRPRAASARPRQRWEGNPHRPRKRPRRWTGRSDPEASGRRGTPPGDEAGSSDARRRRRGAMSRGICRTGGRLRLARRPGPGEERFRVGAGARPGARAAWRGAVNQLVAPPHEATTTAGAVGTSAEGAPLAVQTRSRSVGISLYAENAVASLRGECYKTRKNLSIYRAARRNRASSHV